MAWVAIVRQLDQIRVTQNQGHHHRGKNNSFADGQDGHLPRQYDFPGMIQFHEILIVVRHVAPAPSRNSGRFRRRIVANMIRSNRRTFSG